MRVVTPQMRNMNHIHCEECGEPITIGIEFEEEFVTICKSCLIRSIKAIEGYGDELPPPSKPDLVQ